MQTSASAGIEFLAASMRYAEIEHSGEQSRLLRLGDCEFEFDANSVLYGDGPEVYLDTISEAITEVFEGSKAEVFRVAVHPPVSRSFMSSVAVDARESARNEQLVFEAALLDVDRDVVALHSTPGVTLKSTGLPDMFSASHTEREYSDEAAFSTRNHISHISGVMHKRLERVFNGAHRHNLETISSLETVARVVKGISMSQPCTGQSVLSVGVYDDYSMYTLIRNGEWLFSQQRPETEPGDVVYFVMQALRLAKARTSDLGRLMVFGSENLDVVSELLQKVFAIPAEKLNPLSTVHLRDNAFGKDFSDVSFTMCIGAAL